MAAGAAFFVGIDLGTTNCALAYAPLGTEEAAAPAIFSIPQVVHAGEVEALPLLASFVYLPGDSELPQGALALPWDPSRRFVVGQFARTQGAAVVARLVSSAKSWLSHAGVDRRAPILPFGAPDEIEKISPLEASARYLAHLREAWDAQHPDAPLAAQELVITVPASFDPGARELTVEAARLAGLGEKLTLLEEPQAALYAWLAAMGERWRKQVAVGELILVCDVGGGTTDFSLIAVREEEGTLELRRVAVGEHILLGGDNMDLALAYAVKTKLEASGKSLDDWQLRALTHGCRTAKEALFQDATQPSHPVIVPGRGSRLVGGTIRTELTQEELRATLVDGFFPRAAANERTQTARRVGLTTLGLPYASDPAITRHLATFLARNASAAASLGLPQTDFLRPTALLFNGGVSKADPLRERIVEVLDGWLSQASAPSVKVLEGGDADLAVAKGASHFARVRTGRGIRIRGGTAKAYYVGIERAELAVPGVPPRIDAVCVAPFGMEEGSELELPQELGLVVGEPAAFRFFASSTRRDDRLAAVVDPSQGLEELAPIETTLEGEAGAIVPVKLHARVTEIGTLELAAAEASGKKWKLEYDVRVE